MLGTADCGISKVLRTSGEQIGLGFAQTEAKALTLAIADAGIAYETISRRQPSVSIRLALKPPSRTSSAAPPGPFSYKDVAINISDQGLRQFETEYPEDFMSVDRCNDKTINVWHCTSHCCIN